MNCPRRRLLRSLLWLSLSASFSLAGCDRDPAPGGAAPAASGTPVVRVVNYPLRYFAERIAGGELRVELPVPPDVDPAFWKPDAESIAAYQAADLILLNGAGYARWVGRATLPPGKLVDTSKTFRDKYITVADAVTHSHGPEGTHSHAGIAFTTWLDLTLAVEHARATEDAFAMLKPSERATFEATFALLENDLMALDRRLRELTSRRRGEPLFGSHPVYQYLARRYDLNLESVHWEPDEVPAEAMWNELRELRRTHPAKWMLWEGEPLRETVERLRSLGVESVVYSPCGNVPGSGDFLTVMRENVARLERVFEG